MFYRRNWKTLDFCNFQWSSQRKRSVIMGAHGLFCTNMWELRSLKMTLPKTVEALRWMWSAYMELKRMPAQLTRKMKIYHKGSMSFRILEKRSCRKPWSFAVKAVSLHGTRTKTWSAYMRMKLQPCSSESKRINLMACMHSRSRLHTFNISIYILYLQKQMVL